MSSLLPPRISPRPKFFRLGLLGWPVGHSFSAAMHRAALTATGLPGTYEPMAIPPEALADTLREVIERDFTGLNVTVPHKSAVMPHLQAISPLARSVGAVNTILVRSDRTLLGDNTDVFGLQRALAEAGIQLAAARVVILGAGGAARAAVTAAVEEGARQIAVLARRREQAASLVEEISRTDLLHRGTTLVAGDIAGPLNGDVDVVVNATSAGMHPAIDTSPWPDMLPFPPRVALFDMVYNPRETRLMAQARAAGADPVVSGLGMLIYQGARAFELWTGYPAPVEVMRLAISGQ